jgi:hypoxanthine phosphoribosyltransferase
MNSRNFDRYNINTMNENLPPDLVQILIPADIIQARVKVLSERIDNEYAGVECVYLVGILKGAFIFLADLARQLSVPHMVDFMALSSYGKTTTSGAVRILMDLREPIEGQHVLIVEDIVDSGHTLHYLYQVLKGRNPASLRSCVLVRKQRGEVDISIDYLGFDIPDVWVVGYGLDFADQYRTLPYIAEIRREATQKVTRGAAQHEPDQRKD